MERIYDDYDPKNKDLKKRIELKLMRKPSNLISPWDLSHLVSTTSTSYYKVELIDSLKTAINNDISPENIFILTGSFKLHRPYRDLNSFSLNDHLTRLYYIGEPVSLFPNKDLFALSLLFKFFKRLNRFLSSRGAGRLPIDSLKNSYRDLKKEENDFDYPIDKLVKEAKQQYIDRKMFSEASLRTSEEFRDFESRLGNLEKNINSEYQSFLNDDDNYGFSEISKKLMENEEIVLLEDKGKNEIEKKRILDEYYLDFFKRFNRIARPVIGIYHKKEKQVEILCRDNIHSRQDNKAFLDIKEISHKSPLEITMIGLVSLGFLFLQQLIIIKQQRALHEEALKHKKELHELEKKHFEEQREWEKKKEQIDQLRNNEDSFMNSLRNIISKLIKFELIQLYEKAKERTAKNISDNGFRVDGIKTNGFSKEEKGEKSPNIKLPTSRLKRTGM